MRVIRPLAAQVCWIRKHSDGTGCRAPGVEGLTNCSSGRENRPAERAWTVTLADGAVVSVTVSVAPFSLLSVAINELLPGRRVGVDDGCCAYRVAIVSKTATSAA